MMPKSWSSDSSQHPTTAPLSPEITAADLLYSLDASYNVLRSEIGQCYDTDLRREMSVRLETVQAMRTWFRSQKFLDELRARRKL